ncbi:MAG TPA: ABC transporter ATP-binding protein [Mycobacteriales bacterium]|nr:ABC transporter ATP-binding protein [Mycobacteriales bacterium]
MGATGPLAGADRHRTGTPTGLLAGAARRSAGWLAVQVVAEVAGTATALLLPAALAAAIDAALAGRPGGAGLIALGLILAVSAVAAVLSVVAGTAAMARSTAWLQHLFVRHVLAAGAAPHRFADGDLTSRLVGDTAQAGGAAQVVLGTLAPLAMSLGGLVCLWRIDWRLTVAFLVALPAVAVLTRVLLRRLSDLYVEYDATVARIAARLTDALAGARTIRAAGTAGREVARVVAPLPELDRAGRAQWAAQRQASWQVGILAPVVRIAVLATAGFELSAGRISAGEFVAAGSYAVLAGGLLDQVTAALSLAQVQAGARRLAQVLALPVPPAGTDRSPGDGTLRFAAVTASRAGRPLLAGLDLRVPAGASVAVVGRSGAGKSTLARLAGRLIDPDEGTVLLGGRPLPDLDPAELRRRVAYAFEQPELLGRTVAGCIGYGRPDAGLPEIRAAARLASADGFVSRLPAGYQTPLDQLPLSGGERQRLGLARAFLQGSSLLILDDATSSLDTATEAQVSAALTEHAGGRTRLIIAHRVTTAARADLVVWLEAGRLRGFGPHRQLWTDPDYRVLFAPDPTTDLPAPAGPADPPTTAPGPGVRAAGLAVAG